MALVLVHTSASHAVRALKRRCRRRRHEGAAGALRATATRRLGSCGPSHMKKTAARWPVDEELLMFSDGCRGRSVAQINL
eukprot:6198244-Pleurochrysis_carterae.AAC.1